MRRIKTIIVLLASVILLTGCVRFEAGMNIDKRGKTDISLLYAYMEVEETDISETMSEFENDGWEIKEYSQNGYTGFIAKQEDVDIKELMYTINNAGSEFESESESESDLDDLYLSKKGNTYTISWLTIPPSDMAELSSYLNYVQQYGGYLQFNLTLPYGAISSNATSVSSDGKTLTWDLIKQPQVEVEFRLYNPLFLVFIISAIIVTLIAIIVVVVIISLKKKKRVAISNPYTYNQQHYTYGQDYAQQGEYSQLQPQFSQQNDDNPKNSSISEKDI